MDSSPTVLARADTARGEIVLRRRGTVLELIVAGVFAMDSAHTGTERALAALALERVRGSADRPDGLHLVVAGLGLGYTLATVLADPGVATVDLIELDEHLVGWARDGLVQPAGRALEDPRVSVQVADVRDAVAGLATAATDVLLLDVDNGPGFLVHPGNADVYRPPFLTEAARVLRPGGVLAVWSADPAPELSTALHAVLGSCQEVRRPVQRDGREFEYSIYLAG